MQKLSIIAIVLAGCGGLYGESAPQPDASVGATSPEVARLEEIDISPATIAIDADCTQPPRETTIVLTSKRPDPVEYHIDSTAPSTVGLRDTRGEIVDGLVGVLAAGSKTTIPVVAFGKVPGPIRADLLVSIGGRLQRIAIDGTVRGGALAFSPAIVDFGQVRKNTSTPGQPVELVNTGTAPVTIAALESTSVDRGEFTVPGNETTIDPGQKLPLSVVFAPGGEGNPLSADFVPRPTTALCTETPVLGLRGQRVDQVVTVAPGRFDFRVDCATPGNRRQITVTNYSSTTAATFLVKNNPESWYALTPSEVSVPPGSPGVSRTIEIGLKAPRPLPEMGSETIEITVTGPETRTLGVRVYTDIAGSLLTVSPDVLDFDATPNQGRTFELKNTKNEPIDILLRSTNPTFSLPTPRFWLPDLLLNTRLVNVVSAGGGAASGTIVIERDPEGTGVLCGPVPTIRLTR